MKGIIFPELPYNTDRNFVRGVSHSGCEIWIPVAQGNDLQVSQDAIQLFLDNQPIQPKETA